MKTIITIIIFCVFANVAFSQNDTLEQKPKVTTEFTKSPMGAIWRSFVLPGLGQYYVESYWKIPIITGGWAALVYSITFNQINYIDARNVVNNYTGESATELRILTNRREYYRDNRDMSGLFLLGVYAIAAIDSYVGAHLFDFNVDDNLSFYAAPDIGGGIKVGFTYAINQAP